MRAACRAEVGGEGVPAASSHRQAMLHACRGGCCEGCCSNDLQAAGRNTLQYIGSIWVVHRQSYTCNGNTSAAAYLKNCRDLGCHLHTIHTRLTIRDFCTMHRRRGLDLDVSLLERLATCGRFPVNSLVEQRRMRPDISRCGLEILCTRACRHYSGPSFDDVYSPPDN